MKRPLKYICSLAANTVAVRSVLLLLLLLQPSWAAAQEVGEYHIKAVFLTNLTHFVNWPAQGEEQEDAFVIGIYGPDPFGSIIDRAVTDERKQNRPVRVERYAQLATIDPRKCRILFIHHAKLAEWEAIRNHIAGFPVLTVADAPGFPEEGGMVNLLKNDRKIQVEINNGAVLKAGLAISSKLLSLARIVQ